MLSSTASSSSIRITSEHDVNLWEQNTSLSSGNRYANNGCSLSRKKIIDSLREKKSAAAEKLLAAKESLEKLRKERVAFSNHWAQVASGGICDLVNEHNPDKGKVKITPEDEGKLSAILQTLDSEVEAQEKKLKEAQELIIVENAALRSTCTTLLAENLELRRESQTMMRLYKEYVEPFLS